MEKFENLERRPKWSAPILQTLGIIYEIQGPYVSATQLSESAQLTVLKK
jgi:hypothetical protein